MNYWYKDRDFPEIKTVGKDGYVEIMGVIEDPFSLQRLITEHNKLVDELRDCRQLKEADNKALKTVTEQLAEAQAWTCDKADHARLETELAKTQRERDNAYEGVVDFNKKYEEARAERDEARATAESHKKAWVERVDMCIEQRTQLQSQAAQLAGMREALNVVLDQEAGKGRFVHYEDVLKMAEEALSTPATEWENRLELERKCRAKSWAILMHGMKYFKNNGLINPAENDTAADYILRAKEALAAWEKN